MSAEEDPQDNPNFKTEPPPEFHQLEPLKQLLEREFAVHMDFDIFFESHGYELLEFIEASGTPRMSVCIISYLKKWTISHSDEDADLETKEQNVDENQRQVQEDEEALLVTKQMLAKALAKQKGKTATKRFTTKAFVPVLPSKLRQEKKNAKLAAKSAAAADQISTEEGAAKAKPKPNKAKKKHRKRSKEPENAEQKSETKIHLPVSIEFEEDHSSVVEYVEVCIITANFDEVPKLGAAKSCCFVKETEFESWESVFIGLIDDTWNLIALRQCLLEILDDDLPNLQTMIKLCIVKEWHLAEQLENHLGNDPMAKIICEFLLDLFEDERGRLKLVLPREIQKILDSDGHFNVEQTQKIEEIFDDYCVAIESLNFDSSNAINLWKFLQLETKSWAVKILANMELVSKLENLQVNSKCQTRFNFGSEESSEMNLILSFSEVLHFCRHMQFEDLPKNIENIVNNLEIMLENCSNGKAIQIAHLVKAHLQSCLAERFSTEDFWHNGVRNCDTKMNQSIQGLMLLREFLRKCGQRTGDITIFIKNCYTVSVLLQQLISCETLLDHACWDMLKDRQLVENSQTMIQQLLHNFSAIIITQYCNISFSGQLRNAEETLEKLKLNCRRLLTEVIENDNGLVDSEISHMKSDCAELVGMLFDLSEG